MTVEVEAVAAVVFDPAAVAKRISAVVAGKPVVSIMFALVEKMSSEFVENRAAPMVETAVGQMQTVEVVD